MVAPWKSGEVDRLVRAIESKPVVGIANISGIPASAMQKMRRGLRGKAELLAAKHTLLDMAIKRALPKRKGLDGLTPVVDSIAGATALVVSDLNPFRLYKALEITKSPSPAKGGEAAPADIEIKAGETSFKPGPIVAELQKAGIPAAVEGGKVVVKKDKTVLKAGQTISRDLALALAKMEIFPLTVGLDLQAVFDGAELYRPDVLRVDEEMVKGQVIEAIRHAYSLSLNAAFPTADTVTMILQKAHREALALALAAAYPEADAVTLILQKARREAGALAGAVAGKYKAE